MPLFEMSANVQEPDSVGRKRSHDEFSGEAVKMDVPAEEKTPSKTTIRPSGDSSECKRSGSQICMDGSLTNAGAQYSLP